MFHNNGLLYHNVIIAAGLLSNAGKQVLYIHVFCDFGAD